MFPERIIVDAVTEDVCSCVVEIVFEKLAVFPTMLEMLKFPFGFVIAVELRRNVATLSAVIVVYTVRLLV